MEEREVLEIFAECRAIVKNSHFVYKAGDHGPHYVNKDAIFPYTLKVFRLCEMMAREYQHSEIETVLAPAVAGTILSTWVSYHLSLLTGREVHAIYADKDGDNFIIKRGYKEFTSGRRILVVEDVLTTGETAGKVIETARNLDGIVLGVACLCNRGGVTSEKLNVPKLFSLVEVNFTKFKEEECPLCTDGIPFNTVLGHGQEYLDRKKREKEASALL